MRISNTYGNVTTYLIAFEIDLNVLNKRLNSMHVYIVLIKKKRKKMYGFFFVWHI